MFINVSQRNVHLWPGFDERIIFLLFDHGMLKPNQRSSSSTYAYQISSVTDCSLKRVGTLPFSMKFGSCFTNNDQIVLCFDANDDQQCYRSNQPLDGFTAIAKSRHPHSWIRMASSTSKLILVRLIYIVYLQCTALLLVVVIQITMPRPSY